MPNIPNCSAIRQTANCVTLYFVNEAAARDYFNTHTAGGARPIEVNTAPARHHVERGCCDGTDPAGCNQRREAEAKAAKDAEREDRRQERERNRRDEYAGTEPTDAATRKGWTYAIANRSICRHNRVTQARLGDKCPDCGFVF